MWIFDSYYKGCVELWARDRRVVSQSEQYPQSFYLYLKDAHAHLDMIAGLESRFKVEETSFRTIYGVSSMATKSMPAGRSQRGSRNRPTWRLSCITWIPG